MNPIATRPLAVDLIPALVRERGSAPFWLDDAGERTWGDFGAAVEAFRQQAAAAGLAPGAVVVTPGEADFGSLACLFGLAAAGAVVAPLRRERAAELERWKEFVPLDGRVVDGRIVRVDEGRMSLSAKGLLGELRARGRPGLILATGGTTGVPKLVLHELDALLAAIPVKAGRTRRTMPLLRFDHIGGLDVAWRALAGGQVLVAPPAPLTPSAVAAAAARHRVEVLPATPSFLNLLLLAEAHRQAGLDALRVIPYGAEPMPPELLRRLRTAFPEVEFVQRFGTSETGALPARDAAGGLVLPEEEGFAWRIEDGELWVRSPARALGYLTPGAAGFASDGWFRTGDLAERRPDGAVRVLGRRGELINVGGEKVLPFEVEAVLLAHPSTIDCRVRPESSAVLGQVVAAEVVWGGPERDPLAVKQALHRFAAGRLARHQLPAVVRLVPSVAATSNLKKSRTFFP